MSKTWISFLPLDYDKKDDPFFLKLSKTKGEKMVGHPKKEFKYAT